MVFALEDYVNVKNTQCVHEYTRTRIDIVREFGDYFIAENANGPQSSCIPSNLIAKYGAINEDCVFWIIIASHKGDKIDNIPLDLPLHVSSRIFISCMYFLGKIKFVAEFTRAKQIVIDWTRYISELDDAYKLAPDTISSLVVGSGETVCEQRKRMSQWGLIRAGPLVPSYAIRKSYRIFIIIYRPTTGTYRIVQGEKRHIRDTVYSKSGAIAKGYNVILRLDKVPPLKDIIRDRFGLRGTHARRDDGGVMPEYTPDEVVRLSMLYIYEAMGAN